MFLIRSHCCENLASPDSKLITTASSVSGVVASKTESNGVLECVCGVGDAPYLALNRIISVDSRQRARHYTHLVLGLVLGHRGEGAKFEIINDSGISR